MNFEAHFLAGGNTNTENGKRFGAIVFGEVVGLVENIKLCAEVMLTPDVTFDPKGKKTLCFTLINAKFRTVTGIETLFSTKLLISPRLSIFV